jgi:hypothetical protein
MHSSKIDVAAIGKQGRLRFALAPESSQANVPAQAKTWTGHPPTRWVRNLLVYSLGLAGHWSWAISAGEDARAAPLARLLPMTSRLPLISFTPNAWQPSRRENPKTRSLLHARGRLCCASASRPTPRGRQYKVSLEIILKQKNRPVRVRMAWMGRMNQASSGMM